MKIYRISLERSGHEHDGYRYFTSKKAAQKALKEENHTEYFHAKEIDELEIVLTKKGVMAFLNAWAAYSDNG